MQVQVEYNAVAILHSPQRLARHVARRLCPVVVLSGNLAYCTYILYILMSADDCLDYLGARLCLH